MTNRGLVFAKRTLAALTLTSLALAYGIGWASPAYADLGCEKFLVAHDFQQPKRLLETTHELRIGTYNVRDFLLGHHETLRDGTPRAPKPERDIQGIARALRDMNLDLIVVQEVDIDGLRKLDAQLKKQYLPILVRGNDPSGIDVGFLVKKDLPFDIENDSFRAETWIDPRLPKKRADRVFSRDLPALVFRATNAPVNSSPLFILLGTHYKSKRAATRHSAHDTGSIRAAQIERTVEIVERYRAEYGSDVPIILAGDFNSAVDRGEVAPLRDKAGLHDAFDLSPQKVSNRDRVTHAYFPGHGQPPDYKQMDAVFVSNGLENSIVATEVYRYKRRSGYTNPLPTERWMRDRNPSDHYPVRATIQLDAIKARLGLL